MVIPGPLSSAVIIAVGSELLTPDHIDTNSLFLTRELNQLGIIVRYKTVVRDDSNDLVLALQIAMQQTGLVIVTGGLGATSDDITRPALASAFGLSLHENASVASVIQERFNIRGIEMPEINLRQALIPEGADVLFNSCGTAPGFSIEKNKVLCVALPGPPRELRPMFQKFSKNHLVSRSGERRTFRRVIVVAGRSESDVETAVQSIYVRWLDSSQPVFTSVLASSGKVELHLSTIGANAKESEQVLTTAVAAIAEVLGESLVSTDGSPIEVVVGRLLKDRGVYLAVAESCTGGLTSSRLTDVAGSSGYLHSGWVVYSDEAKVKTLGIDYQLIKAHGAVSKEVAEAMAMSARELADVQYALGITGIAGPAGGSAEKPVGTVWIALVGPHSLRRTRLLRLSGERADIKYQASQAALDLLRRVLLQCA